MQYTLRHKADRSFDIEIADNEPVGHLGRNLSGKSHPEIIFAYVSVV